MALPRLPPAAAVGCLASLLVAGCWGGSTGAPPPALPAAVATASPSPSAPPSAPTLGPPALYLPRTSPAGLPLVSGRDHLGYLEAASLEINQAAALELYRSFDWRDAATRTFAAGTRRVEETVLISEDQPGARRAYTYWAALARQPPLLAVPCPQDGGLDQCAAGQAGTRSRAAGRRGRVVFTITADGVLLTPLLVAGALALSAGPPA